jgi:Ala-tRNA(Pro) deacylase
MCAMTTSHGEGIVHCVIRPLAKPTSVHICKARLQRTLARRDGDLLVLPSAAIEPVMDTSRAQPVHATPAELLASLEGHGLRTQTVAHDAVFTVEESEAVTAHIPGAHTKNLFLKDKKGRFFLVSATKHARIDLKRLHEVIGASGRLSFGSAEQLLALLGVTPGSVCAFAVFNDRAGDVTMVLDAELMAAATVNFHPLTNTMTTSIAPEDLVAFLRKTGHDPLIIALPEPSTT